MYWRLDENRRPVEATREQMISLFEGPFEDTRRVGRDQVGDAEVSTVFLVIDHRMGGDGPPVLFETMIFGGAHDQETWRYTSWQDATEGHERVVAALREGRDP